MHAPTIAAGITGAVLTVAFVLAVLAVLKHRQVTREHNRVVECIRRDQAATAAGDLARGRIDRDEFRRRVGEPDLTDAEVDKIVTSYLAF